MPDQDADGIEDLLVGTTVWAGPAVPGALDAAPIADGVTEFLGRVAIQTSGDGWLVGADVQRYAWEGSSREPPIGAAADGLLLVPWPEAVCVFRLPVAD